MTKNINFNYIKESAKPSLTNVVQMIKILLMWKKHKMQDYLLNTNKKLNSRISWSVKNKYRSHTQNLRRCRFCLREELEIGYDPYEILLSNIRSHLPVSQSK